MKKNQNWCRVMERCRDMFVFVLAVAFVTGDLAMLHLDGFTASRCITGSAAIVSGLFAISFIALLRCNKTSFFIPVAFLTLFLTGALSAISRECFEVKREDSRILKLAGNKPRNVRGTVVEVGKSRSGRTSVMLIPEGGRERSVLYLLPQSSGGEETEMLRPGDTIMARARVKPVENFTESFDYVKYMAEKSIFAICFEYRLKGGGSSAKFLPCENPPLRYRIKRWKIRAVEAFIRLAAPLGEENRALLLAFILGDRSLLSEEIISDFRTGGMMHALALSGMHVGIIYLFLNILLALLGKKLAARIFRSVIILGVLWPYALLTGLGTSIFRAVTMTTIYELTALLGREKNLLNTLGLAAVVITIIEPHAPAEVSFQLSFGAMLGIALFFNPLRGLAHPPELSKEERVIRNGLAEVPDIPEGDWVGRRVRRNRVEARLKKVLRVMKPPLRQAYDKTWELLALSMSCQIITAPIVYFVFGTYAHWSLLSNLLCSPLVSISMMLAPICAGAGGIPLVGPTLFHLLDFSLSALRFIVAVIGP